MSDTEEENYCYYGKPLEPYDEDAFPKRKPISVEEQVATDAQGRRRFHGAFTGGFSAGFFNTVGSLEGWLPGEFRSTRGEKAENVVQKPEDFMDEEDMGEFGIAPQTVRATKEYSTSKKRKKHVFSDGPIPGEPALHSILAGGNETIGYLLLRNLGRKNKKDSAQESSESSSKIYGCEMPKTYEITRHSEESDDVIPQVYKECLKNPKVNTHGLGYEGLDRTHVNLFESAKLVINERNKKKVSISGQAFGVGAFEDDDEDIYVKEDMSKYDFELTSEKASKKDTLPKGQLIYDDFVAAKTPLVAKETFLPPTIPHSFTGKHKVKKSRFAPLPSTPVPERRDMHADVRARYLGEEVAEKEPEIKAQIEPQTPQESVKNEQTKSAQYSLDSLKSGLLLDKFVSASTSENVADILEEVKPMETTHGTEQMRAAVKMKMFGALTRITEDWQPCNILCRRFNVPEPNVELNASKNRKRTKNLVFEFEKDSDMTCDLKPGLSIRSKAENQQKEVKIEEESVPDSQMDNCTGIPTPDVVIEIPQSKSDDKTASISEEVSEKSTSEADKEETPKLDPPLDITDRIHVENNIDLFNAVFMSSDEESEKEEDPQEIAKNTENKLEEMKNNVLSETLLPKIKPMKEGILSNVDFSVFETSKKPSEAPEENVAKITQETVSKDVDNSSYGPRLPQNLVKEKAKQTTEIKPVVDDSDDWVEKGEDGKERKSSSKSKKKHKKNKKKHKHKKRE